MVKGNLSPRRRQFLRSEMFLGKLGTIQQGMYALVGNIEIRDGIHEIADHLDSVGAQVRIVVIDHQRR